MKSDLVDIDVQVHARTERAVLVSDDGDEKRAEWIPLSQCEVRLNGVGMATITCPESLALEKGLI